MSVVAVAVANDRSTGLIERREQYRARTRRWRLRTIAGFLPLLAVAALWPLAAPNPFFLIEATLAFMWMALSLSWNLLSGFTGYISFGHAALFGLGGYTVALATTRAGISVWVALILAFGGAAIASLLFGALTLRLKTHYFAIASLGVAEALQVLVSYAQGWTGGTTGLALPYSLIATPTSVPYFVALALLTLTTAIAFIVLWSKFGLRLLSIREDETAAESLGINTRRHKIAAFVISGALTGVLGGLYAWVLGFLTPDAVLSPSISLQISVMAIIGGMGTVLGPLLGGLAFFAIGEVTVAVSPNLHLLVLGIILVLGMLFLRHGVVGTLERSRFWPAGLRI